ncbi:integrase-like protein [Luteococcus japonicus]|uniref:Integrase-like protein n=1 Tax=Luteococcus japonicus TaxID=33984 RepID=A0A3N1ZWA0_9ACTN|nr:DDE-type integrase/transposase/recombinase [Luteococcus japonicus]ROR55123.1 integrase-like protein [Luteococcus japonicus]
MTARVLLDPGQRVLTNRGIGIVERIERDGVTIVLPHGQDAFIDWGSLVVSPFTDGELQAQEVSLSPWWEGLPEAARTEALERMRVVLEILTGFRSGHASLAEPGEPFEPFGPGYGAHEKTQRMLMAKQLERHGQKVTQRTIFTWLRAWEREGLRGLVDGRRARPVGNFERLPDDFKAAVDDVLTPFDGDVSTVNRTELERRAWLGLRQRGLPRDAVPERLAKEYISLRYKALGNNPRGHKATKVRARAGRTSFPAIHPSHVCMDVTRADNLVYDPVLAKPVSVEIITVLSVSTRVVLACRVVPRSASSVEAGLALYDTMRPFSLHVTGTKVTDWAWAGLPQSLQMTRASTGHSYVNMRPDLQGEHHIPSVEPTAVRTDHGAIFVSAHFQALLRDFAIDYLPSRVGASTDNSFVERWHETLQRALQELPGYKGRNVKERGRFVAKQVLLTASELETHLHKFIALDYHRAPHDGLLIPQQRDARWTPIEFFDIQLAATGRIDVPQHPDLIYQFLPIVWLTPRHSGVEYRNLTYDAAVLDEPRVMRTGRFQPHSRKVPFHTDPRDVSRLWFRDPDTDRIHEIPWRGRHLLNAPMTNRMRDRALELLRERDGRKLRRSTATHQIIDALGQLTTPKTADEWATDMAATRLRWEQAQRDHDEVMAAHQRMALEPRADVTSHDLPAPTAPAQTTWWAGTGPWPSLDEPNPGE